MNYYDFDNFDFEKHIDNLIDVCDRIKPNDVTVLVGPNGYGKSLIRKLLGDPNSELGKAASISMQRRTQPNHDFAAFSTLAIDDAETATSNSSFMLIDQLFKSTSKQYLILDEPEVGMGKEAILGLANWVDRKVEERKEKKDWNGMLVITHSDYLISNLKYDNFIDLNGLSFEQWKTREINPIDPEALRTWCHKMWLTIVRRSEQNKANK